MRIFNYILLLLILSLLTIKIGYEVFNRLDAKLFSHSAVPVKYSLAFIILLIGIGFILGILINSSTKISKLIIVWPVVHIIIILCLLMIGLVGGLLLGIVLYSIVMLPINLIGESISLGFQIKKLHSSNKERLQIIGFSIINAVIIILIFYGISREYLANLFL